MLANRTHRNSVYNTSGSNALNALRTAIKAYESNKDLLAIKQFDLYHIETSYETVLINRKEKKVRRVYLSNHKYKIGWVVDSDLNICNICYKDFGWYRGRPKHHCRACGSLVCHECSPFNVPIPYLNDDEPISRVCKNCFGFKPSSLIGLASPVPPQQPSPMPSPSMIESHPTNLTHLNQSQVANTPYRGDPISESNSSRKSFKYTNQTNSTVSYSPMNNTPNTMNSVSTRRSVRQSVKYETEESLLQKYTEEMERMEQEQMPKYLEAYRMMRELIPLDIYKCNINRLYEVGLPLLTANRIFNNKILWLICMHPDDIVKLHLADFRSKYAFDGLDIIEMRAIWFCLPTWDPANGNSLEKGKAEWKEGLKSKLDDMNYKEAKGNLPPHLLRNPAYEEADFLHLFDPDFPINPRFHRSASYKQYPVDSPMVDSNGIESSQPHYTNNNGIPVIVGFKERQENYVNHCKENEPVYDSGRRDKKFQTFLQEINGDDVLPDLDISHIRKVDYDDEISSLGADQDVSTEELFIPQQPIEQPRYISKKISSDSPRDYPPRDDRKTLSPKVSFSSQHGQNNDRRGAVSPIRPMNNQDLISSSRNSSFSTISNNSRSMHVPQSTQQSHSQRNETPNQQSTPTSKKRIQTTSSPKPTRVTSRSFQNAREIMSASEEPDNSGIGYPYTNKPSPDSDILSPAPLGSVSTAPRGGMTTRSRPGTTPGLHNSHQSYKFLSTSKNYGRRIDDSFSLDDNYDQYGYNTPDANNQYGEGRYEVSNQTPFNHSFENTSAKVVQEQEVSKPPKENAVIILPSYEEILDVFLDGNVENLYFLLKKRKLTEVFEPEQIDSMYWKCRNSFLAQYEVALFKSLLYFIDENIVDINLFDEYNQTLLHPLVADNQEALGRELIRRGADILYMDIRGECPLSISIQENLGWVEEEFEDSGKEMRLLSLGNIEKRFQYVSFFILSGNPEKAKKIIKAGQVKISADEATELLNSSRGNFDSMKDPMGTFELLESLGAVLE